MSDSKPAPPAKGLRAPTDVLTRGFDPTLSVGSARPAVFRSSTYVMTDIARACLAAAALAPRPAVLVDNTLLGPEFQHPLELGADLVLYSATQYLSGFSDLLGGAVLARGPEPLRRAGAREARGGEPRPLPHAFR